MRTETDSERLDEIVARERSAGCVMADESLIPIAVRRWKSFERRHQRSKNLTLVHRANDLLKIFLAQFPEHTYDHACLKHLADSFSLVLCASTDDRDPIMSKMAPISCTACGSTSFITHGRIGHWDGPNGGGDMLGAVCNNCELVFVSRVCGIPTAHADWSIDESSIWLD
ncbi:hypothetical protein CA13_73600 [Planctomycetes bacterium CA13]|uniref:Uncharacterized protein n=1 Tax=Novipirellula herctigrandis TaxID=2527986 RepID=A0A5C5YLU6_9BACT|nr:hypothetical protein CA13_73600 [Planctomycetes bacterium CA13]